MKIVHLPSDRVPAIGVREYDESTDLEYVARSWFFKASELFPSTKVGQHRRYASSEHINEHKERVLVPLIERSNSLVACHPEHPSQILGYTISEVQQGCVPVLHFCYTKGGPWRRCGIATELLRQSLGDAFGHPGYYTHQTRPLWHLSEKWNFEYDPYRVFAGQKA